MNIYKHDILIHCIHMWTSLGINGITFLVSHMIKVKAFSLITIVALFCFIIIFAAYVFFIISKDIQSDGIGKIGLIFKYI